MFANHHIEAGRCVGHRSEGNKTAGRNYVSTGRRPLQRAGLMKYCQLCLYGAISNVLSGYDIYDCSIQLHPGGGQDGDLYAENSSSEAVCVARLSHPVTSGVVHVWWLTDSYRSSILKISMEIVGLHLIITSFFHWKSSLEQLFDLLFELFVWFELLHLESKYEQKLHLTHWL